MKETFPCELECPRCKHVFLADVTVIEDPGIRTFSNGDPGYPGTCETEFGAGFPLDDTCGGCGIKWDDDDLTRFHEQAINQTAENLGDEEEGGCCDVTED